MDYTQDPNPHRLHVYGVSELNQNIKKILEEKFAFIWISGEISNFKIPSSGHCYFTLKDQQSQISAILFRPQARSLKFVPEDGMSIIGLGRVGVYAPRGTYQIVFEYLEPRGVGALQIAFEKLKEKLSAEGLFDVSHKKPLPTLPKKISIVTSPSGAAVRDFIKVAQRRFPNLPLEVIAVSVQGERSSGEIIQAIQLLNRIGGTDIIVLARGGGSIEDLSAFNDEPLARAIFASRIPIVSAVGHETDFTIADFVADLRAPTPSAAAEMVVPSKIELKEQLNNIEQKLYHNIYNYLNLRKFNYISIHDRMIHPKRRLQDMRMRLDDCLSRMSAMIKERMARNRERIEFRGNLLKHVSPLKKVDDMQSRLAVLRNALTSRTRHLIEQRRKAIDAHVSVLDALNPLAILKRGYSITRTLPGRNIVRDATTVSINQTLEILLGSGELTVSVNTQKTDESVQKTVITRN